MRQIAIGSPRFERVEAGKQNLAYSLPGVIFLSSSQQHKIEELGKYLMLRAPQLLPVKLVSGWAGYRPMIEPQYKDALPIVGAVNGIKGYFNNCGYGEFGITLAPIAGELISQVIMNQPTAVNIKPFLLSRFKNKV